MQHSAEPVGPYGVPPDYGTATADMTDADRFLHQEHQEHASAHDLSHSGSPQPSAGPHIGNRYRSASRVPPPPPYEGTSNAGGAMTSAYAQPTTHPTATGTTTGGRGLRRSSLKRLIPRPSESATSRPPQAHASAAPPPSYEQALLSEDHSPAIDQVPQDPFAHAEPSSHYNAAPPLTCSHPTMLIDHSPSTGSPSTGPHGAQISLAIPQQLPPAADWDSHQSRRSLLIIAAEVAAAVGASYISNSTLRGAATLLGRCGSSLWRLHNTLPPASAQTVTIANNSRKSLFRSQAAQFISRLRHRLQDVGDQPTRQTVRDSMGVVSGTATAGLMHRSGVASVADPLNWAVSSVAQQAASVAPAILQKLASSRWR